MSKIMKDLFCWLLLLCMLAGAVACTPQIPPEQQTTEESTTIDGSGTTQDQETTVDTQTEENTTEEVQDVKEPRVIGDRYMIFRIWNFTEQTQAQFQATVDAALLQQGEAIDVLAGSGEEMLVGYAGGWIVDGDVQILKIGVAPAFRRQGIARELLARVAEDARGLGAETISLEVREA
ncbi:MAG: GNAT family N-acetyltransferase, partial [Clostridia bacterium]|nr:GNAT family N-acetyltransferase [Clostridia bacterium]